MVTIYVQLQEFSRSILRVENLVLENDHFGSLPAVAAMENLTRGRIRDCLHRNETMESIKKFSNDLMASSHLHEVQRIQVPRAIRAHEAFFISGALRAFDRSVLLESGTLNGGSAAKIATLSTASIYSFDIGWVFNFYPHIIRNLTRTYRRLNQLGNIHFGVGDGKRELPSLARNLNSKPGVFLDQPKGIKAISLCQKMICHELAAFCAIHDMPKEKIPLYNRQCCKASYIGSSKHILEDFNSKATIQETESVIALFGESL